ncbi:hypothetical protein CPB83DRAFT_898871 [Crepidotus variabilis]|uniref:Uncharacterized protein n=1 Tax=Crepidotus variabilis TaxID=179855 RepID=A0A9P6E696_9AGAR|nr:hypothetical protein CPB83DRAFT_898871 [Crepidotus variabilis]
MPVPGLSLQNMEKSMTLLGKLMEMTIASNRDPDKWLPTSPSMLITGATRILLLFSSTLGTSMGKRTKSKANKSKKSKKASKVVWSTEEIDILKSYEDKWFALPSQEEQQKLAYSSIATDLRNLSPEKYGVEVILQRRDLQAEWDKKCGQIKTWYKGKSPATKERRIFRFERRIALRKVVGFKKAKIIDEAVMEKLPEDKKKDRNAYFALYQTTLSEVMQTLSKKEKKQMETIREEWQAEGPPEDVQIKHAQRYAYRAIEEMHKVVNKQFGMIVVTFSARRKKHGGWEYFSHDYNPSLNGPGESVLPISEWGKSECKVFGKQFAKYVQYTDEAKAGHVDVENSQSAGTRQGSVFKLQTTESGLPLLPDPILTSSREELLGTKRDILREFFVSHYRLATGKRGARVPWGAMCQNAQRFLDNDYIPPEVALNDPGRMDGAHVSLLLNHLRDRQKTDGVPTFLFHHYKRHNHTVAAVDYPPDVLVDNKKAFEGKIFDQDSGNQSSNEDHDNATQERDESDQNRQENVIADQTEKDKSHKGKQKASIVDDGQPLVKCGSMPWASKAPPKLDANSDNNPCSSMIEISATDQPVTGDARYAPGTTLRVDGDEFPTQNNDNITQSKISTITSSTTQTSNIIGPKQMVIPGSNPKNQEPSQPTVGSQDALNFPCFYGNAAGAGQVPRQLVPNMPVGESATGQGSQHLPQQSVPIMPTGQGPQQLLPLMHSGESAREGNIMRPGQFIPSNFAAMPYFPGFYPPFPGFNPMFAGQYGFAAPGFAPPEQQLITNGPQQSTTLAEIDLAITSRSNASGERTIQTEGQTSLRKRKRVDSIDHQEAEGSEQPRLTRSRTGALVSTKKKPEPFSSGPRKKLNERWDWVADPMQREIDDESDMQNTS